ncbi:beta 1-4 rhamnosyltransferase Cps2T [Clostridium ljungdahlii]|uniref:beta 1-4 rhamnosyltransferase Cps2T n=1 Tax=Clostridium ljungdahlii TaxID=1538 RepID=UPI003865E9F0
MKNIFIIGSKGIPARYGGFETFVDKLTFHKKNIDIKYHVACLAEDEKEFEYNNAQCFNVKVKNIGSARAVLYDIKALKMAEKYIKKNNLKDSIIYILACRIGPFLAFYKKKLEKQGIKVYVNPDGHEWKRSKWNKAVKAYWKYSERLMVRHADFLVCDSLGIEEYVKEEYKEYNPNTTFIAYGADIKKSTLPDGDPKLLNWFYKNGIKSKQYYLIVGRFVPENNYEVMIREIMASKTDKDLVIITNVEKNKFYDELLLKTHFDKDKRIKFVGTVYDQELIKKIRENAYAYIHGHEVGGTNPSLLEALASTQLNLLVDVNFNREVGRDGAIYFKKSRGDLSTLIKEIDKLDISNINKLSENAKNRIISSYSWNKIVNDYEELFGI